MHVRNNSIICFLCGPLIAFCEFFGEHFPEAMVRLRYYVRFGKKLNLENPRNLNEKILYLSLRTDTTLWTQLADKNSVRKYVIDNGLADILVVQYAHWSSLEEVNFDLLPDKFVIKSVQGSGDIIIVKDKNNINEHRLMKEIHKMFIKKYGALEGGKHYLRIKPGIVVEELLPCDDGNNSIVDYKMWCFNGSCHYVWVCSNRNKSSLEVMLYDSNWNAHPEYMVNNEHYIINRDLIKEPENFDLMKQIAGKLSHPFPCVRIDLYNIKGEIYFGEMTFTSLGGMMNYFNDEFLNICGKLIHINGCDVQ